MMSCIFAIIHYVDDATIYHIMMTELLVKILWHPLEQQFKQKEKELCYLFRCMEKRHLFMFKREQNEYEMIQKKTKFRLLEF